MHLDLAFGAVQRDLGDAGHLRAGIVEIGEAERSAVAFPPLCHIRHAFHRLDGARRVFQEFEMVLEGIHAALACDLVDKRLGGESVGKKADPAQWIGTHPGIAIELLHQLFDAKMRCRNEKG